MFSHTRSEFEAISQQVLAAARKLGASQCAVEVSEGMGLSVSTRKREVEKVEYNRDKSLGVTVYIGQKRGNASTSDLKSAALEATVRAAYDIARFTAEDDCAGLPEASLLERNPIELDLLHPWQPSVDEAVGLCMRMEDAAFKSSRYISNSDGASVSAQQSHFFAANSAGFGGGYGFSRHTLSCTPITGKNDDMHVDGWYSSQRKAADLASPEAIGVYAAARVLSRRGARRMPTMKCPVLFESPLAAGLLGGYVQATSGGSLYRKASFLNDSLGTQTWASHVDLFEDPHIRGGKASSAFDDEGVRTTPREVVSQGITQGYFLSTYTARKLKMQTTGNGGGSHNLRLSSRKTKPGDDLPAMLRKLGRGLFVVDLMGSGVNYVTGDYSRGAFGYWVENGEIAYPVHEITIAGNLRDMLLGITAIGADEYTYGGSVLVRQMTVAGSDA
jgi:PmbA protein